MALCAPPGNTYIKIFTTDVPNKQNKSMNET